VERVYATAPFDDPRGRHIGYVSVGVPTAAVLAESRRLLARDVALIVVGSLLVLGLVWAGSDALVLRWTGVLSAAADRFHSGDFGYRIGSLSGPLEFVRVATALDAMAGAIQRRERELEEGRWLVEESERRFRRLAEHAPDIIYRYEIDPTPRLVYVNPAVANALGYTPEEIYADPELGFRLLHLADRDRILEDTRTEPIPGRTLTLRATHRNGMEVWLEARDVPVYDDAGRLVAIEGMARNVTDQRRAERHLRLQASMLEAVGQAVIATDPAGITIYANRAAEVLFGWPSSELMGKNVAEVVTAEGSREWPAEFTAHLRAGSSWTGQIAAKRRDGSVFPALLTGAPVRDEMGQLVATIEVCTDLTQIKRQQAEVALQASALDAAANAIVITDAAGRITWANAAFSELTGHALADVLGQTPAVLKSGAHDAEFYHHLWATILDRRVWRGEIVNRRKDGTLYASEQTITPVCDQTGAVTHFIAIQQDITARKEAEVHIQRQNQMLRSLREIDLAIAGSLDLRVTLTVSLDQIAAYLQVDAACAFLVSPQTQILTLAASRGFRYSSVDDRVRIKLGEGCAGQAALDRAACGVAQGAAAAENSAFAAVLRRERFEAQHAVPLISKGEVRGVLVVLHRAPMVLTKEQTGFFEAVALQAAIAVENAGLFATLQRSNTELALAYDTTLEGWSRALDLRDRETEGHTQRVTAMAEALARRLGMGAEELVHLRRGALLHDIGKMGIPDRILHKAGPLTPEEQEIMRRHPVLGYELLAPIQYLRPALHIPYAHHERWDGAGYPRGLKSDQIPLAARIFAVVDVWDALLSDRPYRPAWTRDAALAHIQGEAGSAFDPDVVRAFIEMIQDPEPAA
jgi:PAS domain S-box-containing protein/putative nucleotidyltransferase with HDIG domain